VDRPGGSDPLVGRLLDGRYLVGARIARGGMATVYEATDLRLDRTVAVKVMPHALAEDEDFSQRFVREARAAARLTHANIVTVFDQGDDDGVLFLAMEYVAGRHTLRDVIRDEAPLSPARTLTFLEEVLKAIAAAHEAGIIHRDIKPENVLIDPQGRLKVADFGLARAISASTAATATSGVLMGTVSYLPPELVTDGLADARSDVYALGVMTFEMLTGTKPHAGDNPIQVAYKHVHNDVPAPSTVVPGIPGYLDAFVARATSRQRDLRPADAHVMLQQLRRVRHAVDHGVIDDAELTDDLTPTVSLSVGAGSGYPPSGAPDPGSAGSTDLDTDIGPAGQKGSDEVFDFAAYDDFSSQGARPRLAPTGENTLRVGRQRSPVARRVADEPSVAGPPTTPSRPVGYRSRRRGWLAFVVVLLLAAGAALAGWYYGIGRFEATPDVLQLTRASAEKQIETAGLTFKVAGTAYSETVPPGRVVSTDPGPGDHVLKAGGTVSALISKGPERHAVPDLKGLSETDAIKQITGRSLTVGHTAREWNEKIKAGVVISFSPDTGTKLRRNDPVQLVVSKGPEPHPIVDYTGKHAAVADKSLSRVGFRVTMTRRYDDNVAKGVVISQTPHRGVGHRGDVLALVVSRGPHLVSVPDVYRSGVSAAEQALVDRGFHYSIEQFHPYLGLQIVVGVSPTIGSMAPYGSTIVLTVV
jgi:serine/threonine protein kinase/beta-lactam-binding protein with PASTA domain